MSKYHKKQEELKKIESNNEDDYANSAWANPNNLKSYLVTGGKGVGFKNMKWNDEVNLINTMTSLGSTLNISFLRLLVVHFLELFSQCDLFLQNQLRLFILDYAIVTETTRVLFL